MSSADYLLKAQGCGLRQGQLRAQGSGLRQTEPRAPSPEPFFSRAPSDVRRGQMLIVVLWVIGLVSLAMGTLTVRSTHELRLGRFPLESLQRQAIAQAGVQQAIRVIQQDTQVSPHLDTLQEPWATGEDEAHQQRLADVAVGDGTFSIGIWEAGLFHVGMIDEERKLNVNQAEVATPDVLRRLIGSVSTGKVDPQQIADAIVDWRDEGTTPASPCDGLTPACHNGFFDSVDELRLVPGMTPELFAALEPYVTVYGSSGQVNVNTAPAIVLNAMGYPGEELVEQRKTQPFESYDGLAVTSTAFTVPVDAKLTSSSSRTSLTAVINRAGCGPTPAGCSDTASRCCHRRGRR